MEQDLISNYILACQTKSDNIDIEDFELEDNISMEKTTKELITVISLKDNPNLNLKVAHPSEYKIEKHSILGSGMIAYDKKAYSILKKQLQKDEVIISIKIEFDISRVLNITNISGTQIVKEVYNTLSKKVKSKLKTDGDIINYVCKNTNKKYDLVVGIIALGNPLYSGSAIIDYMGLGYLIRKLDIITEVKRCKQLKFKGDQINKL